MKSLFYAMVIGAGAMLAAPLGASAQSVQSFPKVSSASGNSTGVTIASSYYEDRANVTCSNFINCFLTFSTIPAKKKLLITNISCTLKTGNRVVQMLMFENNAPTGSSARQLNLPISDYAYGTDYNTPSRSIYYTNFNTSVRFLVRPNASILLNLFTVGENPYFHDISCSIVGTIAAT